MTFGRGAVRAGFVSGLVATLLLSSALLAPAGLRQIAALCTPPSCPLPVVTGVTPAAGNVKGGMTVTIVGLGFMNPTGVTRVPPFDVEFGTILAKSRVLVSDTKITAVVPAHAAGIVNVRVINGAGTSAITPADNFAYTTAAWCALIDLHRVPTSWVYAHAQKFYVYALNCGTVTWPATGTYRVDANLHFTAVIAGSARRSYWLDQAYRNLNRNIPPNGTAVFVFTLTPTFAGHAYVEGLMIKLQQFWFDKFPTAPVQFFDKAVTVAR
jgi:hypothetical protein